MLTGVYAVTRDGGFSEVLQKLPNKIDVIHVEQPWLWPLARKIKHLPKFKNTCLIYGSQNIEAPLKREILTSYHVDNIDEIIAEIDKLEQQATREADISVAVTRSDLSTLIKWGAKCPILAPNGIAPWQAKPEVIESWAERLPSAPWLLYVASAHPPNFTSFTQCIGDSLACIPPDSRLVVAGSVCEHVYRQLVTTRWHTLNLSRLTLLFVLSDDDLAAVKSLAHAFLLPIPSGGGSNIKTAEAIYSGKFVIGSKHAFRGFENFIDLPEIMVANSPTQFRTFIRETLVRPISKTVIQDRRDLLRWDRCLTPLCDEIEHLLKG